MALDLTPYFARQVPGAAGGGPTIRAQDTGAGVFAGVNAQIAEVADVLAEEDATRTADVAINDAVKAQSDFQESLRGRQDYQAFGSEYQRFWQNHKATTLQGLSGRARKKAEARLNYLENQGRTQVRGLAWQKQTDVGRAQLVTQTDQAFEVIGRDPFGETAGQAFDGVAKLYTDAAATGLISQEQAAEAVQSLEQRLGVTQVAALIEANPYDAKKRLAGGEFDGLLQPEKKAQLASAADSEIKRREAEARAAAAEARAQAALDNIVWKAGFEDELAFLRDGNAGGSGKYAPDEVARRMVEQYGPEKGGMLAEQMIADYQRAETFGAKYAEVATATPDELRTMIEEEAAQTAGPEGYQAERAEVSALSEAIQARNKEIGADPGLYAVRHSTAVKDAYATLVEVQSDPNATPEDQQAAANAYAAVAGAELERLTGETGLPYLPGSYVVSVAKQFASQGEGGEGPAATVEGLQQLWGDRWPEVYGQLVQSGALPAGAVVLGSGVGGAAAARLAEVLAVPDEDLKKGLATTEVTAAKDAVSEAMGDFLRVTSQYAGAETTVSAYYDSIERLTLSYMRQGVEAGDAAERAYQELLGGRFTFAETFFVPVEQEPGGEPGTVASKAEELLDKIDAFPVAPEFSGLATRIDVPAYEAPGITEDEKRRQYLSAVADGGYWVTAPDQKGLVLHDPTGSAVLVSGQPLFLPWAAFQGAPGQKLWGIPVPAGAD